MRRKANANIKTLRRVTLYAMLQLSTASHITCDGRSPETVLHEAAVVFDPTCMAASLLLPLAAAAVAMAAAAALLLVDKMF